MSGSSAETAVTRRRILRTLGIAGAASLAGCTSGNTGSESSESTTAGQDTQTNSKTTTEQTTTEPETTQTPSGSEGIKPSEMTGMARNWLQSRSDSEKTKHIFDVYSPKKLQEEYGSVQPSTRGSQAVFENLSYSHNEPPLSFFQSFIYAGETPEMRTVRVDKLPEGTSIDDIRQDLTEAGYEKQGTVNGFDLYLDPQRTKKEVGSVNALGNDRHAFALDYFNTLSKNSLLRSTLEETLRQYGEDVFTEEMKTVEEQLDIQDTFALTEDEEYIVEQGRDSFLEEKYQPVIGGSTLDISSDQKQITWVFENPSDAEAAEEYLREDGDLLDGFNSLSRNGRVITIVGSGKFDYSGNGGVL